MSILGAITIIMGISIAFLFGLLLLWIAYIFVNISFEIPFLQIQFSSSQIASDMSLRLIVGGLGLVIIFLCLRYLYTRIFPSKRRQSVTFQSPQGKIDVTIFAIEDMIKRLLEQHKELAHVRPTVFFKKNLVNVEISSYLAADVNLLDFTQEIQQEIKQKLISFLGQNNEINIKISIRKVMFSKHVQPNNEKIEKEPQIPFRSYYN